MLEAVAFDLWNTLVVEGEGGLLRPRSRIWREVLAEVAIDVTLADLDRAHEFALTEYQRAWHSQRQFRSAEAAAAAATHLGLQLDPALASRLADAFHAAGIESRIELVPGAIRVLDQLRSSGLKTAIICDIGLTPSTSLRHLLTRQGLLDRIDVEAWSDELGWYKPDSAIFKWTLDQLGVGPEAAVHVGDRKRTDVAGARRSGLFSIRFAGVYDDSSELEDADFVVNDLSGVVDIVRQL